MAKKPRGIQGAKTRLNGEELIRSVGVSLLALRYRLLQLDPNDWYTEWQETVDELEVFSSLLAALHEGNASTLEGLNVDLPSNIVAVTIPNPLYKEKRKPSSRNEEEGNSSSWGDIPF